MSKQAESKFEQALAITKVIKDAEQRIVKVQPHRTDTPFYIDSKTVLDVVLAHLKEPHAPNVVERRNGPLYTFDTTRDAATAGAAIERAVQELRTGRFKGEVRRG